MDVSELRLLPELALGHGVECDDPDCEETHTGIRMCWLVFGLYITW